METITEHVRNEQTPTQNLIPAILWNLLVGDLWMLRIYMSSKHIGKPVTGH